MKNSRYIRVDEENIDPNRLSNRIFECEYNSLLKMTRQIRKITKKFVDIRFYFSTRINSQYFLRSVCGNFEQRRAEGIENLVALTDTRLKLLPKNNHNFDSSLLFALFHGISLVFGKNSSHNKCCTNNYAPITYFA